MNIRKIKIEIIDNAIHVVKKELPNCSIFNAIIRSIGNNKLQDLTIGYELIKAVGNLNIELVGEDLHIKDKALDTIETKVNILQEMKRILQDT